MLDTIIFPKKISKLIWERDDVRTTLVHLGYTFGLNIMDIQKKSSNDIQLLWPITAWQLGMLIVGPTHVGPIHTVLGPLHTRDWEPVTMTLQAPPHWWKRWSRSKFASPYAWGTNGVCECKMDVKYVWIPTWHRMDHFSWSLGLLSKTTSWR